MKKNFKKIFGLLAVSALALTGCSAGNNASDSSGADNTLVVGATPVPHAQILEFVKKELAPKVGLNLEIKQYTDYVQPNLALSEGDLDANFYQHVSYLKKSEKDGGYDLTPGKGIHLEPYGIYSASIKNLNDLKEGAKVGITNDPSNQSRALQFLESQGVIKLEQGKDEYSIHSGIAENTKNVKFVELDPASLPRTLDSLDIAVINGNYALEAGLKPSKDALALEETKNNPYANILARNAKLSGEKLKAWEKLEELLHSPEVKAYIEKTWDDGSIIPAF